VDEKILRDFQVRFGCMVRENRKAKKLTQEELGDIIGASAPHIGQIERAETLPSLEKFFELISYLGIDPRKAFYDLSIDDSTYIELCAIASQLQPEDRELLLDIARVVKTKREK